MYKIQFLVGRQKLAEAHTDYDDKDKALAVAREKAQFILSLLNQKPAPQEIEAADRPEDYDASGKFTPTACQRLTDERAVALWGPHPAKPLRVPSTDAITHLGIQLTSDTGQITLLDVPKDTTWRPAERAEWRPSGDYRARILFEYQEQTLELGALDFANTTASRALIDAVEQARVLIAKLRKSPGLGFINFQAVTIKVERVNTQIAFVEELPDFDWKTMEYPTFHF